MKKEVEKKLLGVVKKVVDADVNREKYGEGPPYCPVIFHQPTIICMLQVLIIITRLQQQVFQES